MFFRGKCLNFTLSLILFAFVLGLPCAHGTVILQYFDSQWATIERRMPDVFMSGYGALWIPPISRADSSDYSVGFDVFDRFDLGYEGRPTLYGTESSLDTMVSQAHRAGVQVYVDTVYNHNGFSDGRNGSYECDLYFAKDLGGYPGFVMTGSGLYDEYGQELPFDLEFKNICPSSEYPAPSCETDPYNCRISNLIDINHDTNYQWIRHPIDDTNPLNIPYQGYNVNNRRLYPDVDLESPYGDGVKPFNLDDPMQGDPYAENVNGMLQRFTQWMLEVHGVDGFRLDAVKHMPPGWFTYVYDPIAQSRGRDFWGRQKTPYSFGENINSSFDALDEYHRMDGVGNRTVLDFPLFFAMKSNLGVYGASLGDIVGASFDADDGNGQDGTKGVMFVSSHDTGYTGDPPGLDNLAYAYILCRKGYPIVYHNAQEFGTDRDFPNPTSRGDALGLWGNTIKTLVSINRNFVSSRSGNDFRLLLSSEDVLAYELNNSLVVGLCDWVGGGPGGEGYIDVSIPVDNFGFRNVTLTEVTGNAANTSVDPNGTIPETLTIPDSGSVTLRIPTTQNANGLTHNLCYVMYSVLPPQGTLSVTNKAWTIAADSDQTPAAQRRLTPIDVLTGDTAQVVLQIQSGGAEDDNALIKWNYGLNVDGDDTGDQGIAMGLDNALLAGYENFTTLNSPTYGGGSGTYQMNVDLTNTSIPEGINYISVIAFARRIPETLPPIFNTFRKVVYVDRQPPDLEVAYPQTQTGHADIVGADSYGFVVENPDATANSLHYFWNLSEGVDPLALVNDSNKAEQTDRSRWRFSVYQMQNGDNQRLTLVAYEETGNVRVQDFSIGIAPKNEAVRGSIWNNY